MRTLALWPLRFLLSAILVVAAGFSQSSWPASDPQQIFHTRYHDEFHLPGACHYNIYNLARDLHHHGIDLQASRILQIYRLQDSPLDYHVLRPLQYRRPGFRPLWKYHFVLEHKGQIFDLDFSAQPQPLPADQYFTAMFLGDKNNPLLHRIVVARLPATVYALCKNASQLQTVPFSTPLDGKNVMTLSQYLELVKAESCGGELNQ